MKAKFFITAFIFFVLIFSRTVKSQDEIDFEEFMGMMSETFTEQQLDELSYQLPWEIKVLAYGYGDFSGDYRDDIVLSIREKGVTPNSTVDVYFFENVDNTTYRLIDKKNINWVDLTIEVAFLVKDGVCYVTNRDNSYWYFTSYKIKNDKLVRVKKETYPIEFEKAGN
jgi:hypothetical protein